MPVRDVEAATQRILVCQGPSCLQRGGVEVRRMWLLAAKDRPWAVVPTACLRWCLWAPVTVVYPDAVWLPRLGADRVREAARALAAGHVGDVRGAVTVAMSRSEP
jgi:(2Fe-2S) ferredoxin